MSPRVEGRLPEKLHLDKYKSVRFRSLPMQSGMGPEKSLSESSRLFNDCGSWHMQSGSDPDKELLKI